jgi:hypothetical protein
MDRIGAAPQAGVAPNWPLRSSPYAFARLTGPPRSTLYGVWTSEIRNHTSAAGPKQTRRKQTSAGEAEEDRRGKPMRSGEGVPPRPSGPNDER